MVDQEMNTTILLEHRRVVGARYFLALLNFIAIFAGTVATLTFVIKRGSPPIMQIYLYILIAINMLQMGLCFADYILKTKLGIYLKQLTIISYVVAGLWIILLGVELLTGTLQYGIFRIDLLLVTLIQVIVALIAYLVWPHMDRRAIDAMIQGKARNNPNRRKGISKRFMVMYAFLSIFVITAQVASLLVYKVPPKLYDLFSESRAVKYELNKEGDGYVVAYVYTGTSPYVNIPATYNNKPVVGIKAGALVDDGLMEKYKVSEITFGTLMENDVIVSNLKYIESGAICNNNIINLTIPSTVESVGKGAIVSSSLKNLTYAAQAQFDAKYLSECSALEKIVMSGEEVGTISSLEGMNATTTIEVDKDIYNQYRKDNFSYVSKFTPILGEDEFCLDFYTNFDYYINSIFCKNGEEISLRYSDLKNANESGISPVVDTLAYIRNNHELGTTGAKEASAFRGWYFDPDFTEECVFTENGSVSIKGNTSLYANWVTEYTGTLNWGTHKPDDAPSYVYWTEKDVVSFPVINDRMGYSGGVEWRLRDTREQVYNSQNFLKNITLDATWLLDKPTVDIASDFIGNGFQISSDKNIASFTYDETNALSLVADYAHALNGVSHNGTTTRYSFYWTKLKDSAVNSGNNAMNLTQVSDSGTYKLRVTIHSPYGETASADTQIEVSIAKKAIDMGSVTLPNNHDSMVYSGQMQKMEYSGVLGSENIKVTYTYYDKNGELISINTGAMLAGEYSVVAKFEKDNQAEAVNYLTKSLTAAFTIRQKELTYEGWLGNGTGWSENTVVYSGEEKQYKMQISGVLPGDSVELIYEEKSHTGLNAGEYESIVVGVNNSNYTWSEMMRNHSRQVWRILQKEVSVYEWQVDDSSWLGGDSKSIVYDGMAHSIYAVMNGTVKDERVSFLYSTSPSFTNNATAAAQYSAKIIGVDNPNYYFNIDSSDAECAWEILRRELSVQFTPRNLIYNGNSQGIDVTIGNFISSECKDFELSMFDLTGKSANVIVTLEEIDEIKATITLSNKALYAGSYTASIAGLVGFDPEEVAFLNNYSLPSTSQIFTISERELMLEKVETTYTYNGSYQQSIVFVSGILEKDLTTFDFSHFTTGATNGAISASYGEVEDGKYKLVFQGKNAGTYNISVDEFVNGNDNYKLSAAYNESFNIAQKQLSVNKWLLTDLTGVLEETEYKKNVQFEVVYNYYGYKVTPILSGVIDGESVELALTDSEKVAAAIYETVAVLDQENYPNYIMDAAKAKWIINPYQVDFSWKLDGMDSDSTIYDGEEKHVVAVYTLLGDDTTTLIYEDDNQLLKKNRGKYNVQIKSIENKNYVVGGGAQFIWEITAKEVTLTWDSAWSDSLSLVYTGEYQGPSFVLSGLSNLDVESGELSLRATTYSKTKVNSSNIESRMLFTIDEKNDYAFTGEHGFAVDAGEYSIDKFAILKNNIVDNNYTINSAFSYEIGQRELTLSGVWDYQNEILGAGEYTSSTKLVYNQSGYSLRTSISDGLQTRLGSPDVINLVYSNSNLTNADEYTTIVKGIDGAYAGNYILLEENNSFVWKIEAKVLVLDWNVGTKTFNGKIQTQDATINRIWNTTSGANAYDGYAYMYDDVQLIYSSEKPNSGTNADTYETLVVGVNNKNYQLSEENSNLSCVWTIAPKPVKLSWDVDTVFTYNKEIQYPKAYYIDCSNKKQTEGISYTNPVTEGDYIVAGKHTITALKLDDSNYIIDETQSTHQYTYNILQKELILEWSVNGNTDLTFTYDGVERALVPTATNVCSGDIVSLTYENNLFKNAGEYTISVTDVGNPNYRLENNSKKIVVSPKHITFTWEWNGGAEQEFTYHKDKEYTLIASANGLLEEDQENFRITYSGENSFVDSGAHIVSVIGINDNNYCFDEYSDLIKSLIINKQTVKIEWSGESAPIYDGQGHQLVATIVGLDDESLLTFNYTNRKNEYVNAGEYSIAIDVNSWGHTNYTLDGAVGAITQPLNIQKKVVALEWGDLEKTYYNGMVHTANAIVSSDSICGGDVVVVSSYESRRLTDCGMILENSNYASLAGEYEITAKALSNANYTLEGTADITKTLKIAKQKVSIAWSENELTYNGETQALTALVKGVDDGVSINELTYHVSSNGASVTSAIDAGTYTFEIIGLYVENTNYTLDNPEGSLKCDLTINPLVVNLGWSENTFVYAGKSYALTAVANNQVKDEKVEFTYAAKKLSDTGEIGANSNSAVTVGCYEITVTGIKDSDSAKAANYTLAGYTGDVANSLTITPRPVTLVWNMSEVTYNGESHTVTANVANLIAGDTLTLTYTTNTYTNANANGYEITAINVSNPNYTLEGGTNVSTNLKIMPQIVTIVWTNYSEVIYDGVTHQPSVTVKGLNGGVMIDVGHTFEIFNSEGTSIVSPKNVGAYQAKISGLSDTNYTLEGVANTVQNFGIKPQSVAITWDYPKTVVYDGAAHKPSVTVVGANDGLSVGYTEWLSTGSAPTDVGDSYQASIIALDDSNYTLEGVKNTSKTFAILAQKVRVEWDETIHTYDGEEKYLSATVVGENNGNNVAFTLSGNGYKDAGTYPVSVILNNSNYTLEGVSNATQNLTIDKRIGTLTWAWNGGQKEDFTYNGSEYKLEATVSNIIAGDVVNVIYEDGINGYKNVGSYTVTVIGLNNTNYAISESAVKSQSLTIAKRVVTLTWTWDGGEQQVFTYDGNIHKLEATVTNVAEGDIVNAIYKNSVNGYRNAGTYTVAVIGISNKNNYELIDSENMQKTLTIAKKEISLDWTWDGGAEHAFTYDGAMHTVNAVAVDVIGTDIVNVIYAGNTNSYKDAGEYVITVVAIDNENYVLKADAIKSNLLNIIEKEITFSWSWDGFSERAFTYDGTLHTLTAMPNGVVAGDMVVVSYDVANSYVNAGAYIVTISAISNKNYTFIPESKILTINPRTVEVSWSNVSYTYDGEMHGATVNVTGINGEAVECTLSANSFKNAGAYTVSIAELKNSNYTLEGANNISTSLTISQKVIEFNWTLPDGEIETGAAKAYKAEARNTVDGDVITVEYQIKKNGVVVDEVLGAGTYQITVSGISGDMASNYTLQGTTTKVSNTFTIVEAEQK